MSDDSDHFKHYQALIIRTYPTESGFPEGLALYTPDGKMLCGQCEARLITQGGGTKLQVEFFVGPRHGVIIAPSAPELVDVDPETGAIKIVPPTSGVAPPAEPDPAPTPEPEPEDPAVTAANARMKLWGL